MTPTRTGRASARLVAGGVAVAVLLPVAALGVGLVTAGAGPWRGLVATGLWTQTATTVALLGLTVLGTLLLGGGLAWLTHGYRFPGAGLFAWLLVLPVAVPGYILGLVYASHLSYGGPVQSATRAVFGDGASVPSEGVLVAASVLTLTLYPYVYLLGRASLQSRTAMTYGVARTLGLSPWQAARRVALPLSRPALAAGAMLVAMETLADFATVQYFDVETLSVRIYQVWRGEFDRPAATVLALVALALALAVVAAERLARGRARFAVTPADTQPVLPVRLQGRHAWAATGACAVVLLLAVVTPLVQLALWSSTTPLQGVGGGFDPTFLTAAANSVLLGVYSAVGVVVVATVLTHAARLDPSRRVRLLAHTGLTGYALPGPVLAIGTLLLFTAVASALDALRLPGGSLLVTGTVAGLVYAYVVRFLALGYTTVDASLVRVPYGLTAAALTLGARPARVLRRVHLPLLRPGMAVAAALVAVDAMKELPIVLLLRPFGFETLPVRVWQLAADSRYESAGLPALTIVVVAMVPVLLMFRGGLTPGAASPDRTPPASAGTTTPDTAQHDTGAPV